MPSSRSGEGRCHSPGAHLLAADHPNDSITRLIAGCFRFFTLTQCFDPASLIGPVAPFRHQPFKTEAAGGAKASASRNRYRTRICCAAGGSWLIDLNQ